MIKRILIAIVLVAIIVLGAILILPGLIPTDTYRSKLESELSQTFARDVKIIGDIKLSTFPLVMVETGAVTLSNPTGFSENNFVDVQAMSAKVKLWPLLRKQVEISGVSLNSPTIRLEKQANGQVNWSLSDTSETPPAPKESGPYKRDGRYTEYDPSLALLQISNGKVIYSDASAGQNVVIENINLDLRAPSLRSPLELNGDLIIDGLATRLNAEVKSPHDFLSGEATAFQAKIETDEGQIDAAGQFLKSEDIAFNAAYSSSSDAPLALAERLPLPNDLKIPALTKLAAEGDISYGPNSTKLPKLEFTAEGQDLDISYSGNVDIADAVTANGAFTARLDDLSLINPYLEDPIEALDLLSSVSTKGQISYGPDSIKIPTVEFIAQGSGIDASFDGDIDLSEGATSAGVFSADLDDVSVLQPYLENPIEALGVLSSVDTKGNVEWTGQQFSFTDIQSAVSGPDLSATFNGNAAFDETLSITGTFDGQTPDLATLVETAGLSQPDAAALKRLSAQGQIAFVDGTAKVSNLTAEASEGLLNGKYSGDFSYDETEVGLNGQFSGEISDLKALDDALPRDIPYSDVAKRITLSSQIATTEAGYALSNLTAALEDGLLNGDFKGRLAIGDNSDISGRLTLAAESLRSIGVTQNVDVPPSTPVGSIFEAFRLSGEVSGTAERINFDNGSLGLDDISTSGDFVLNMTGAKPLLTGRLEMNALDLRPYMAAWSEQKPEGVILPWSTNPINLGGLEAVNAEIDFTAPEIVTDRLKLGATEGRIDLKNAMLSTSLNKAELYGGLVNGSLSISGASGVPTISIKADIDSVTAQNFLSAASGFNKVAGTANLSLSLDGQGVSQEAIMKSLTGTGSFKVLKGQLLGVDAGELISGLDAALANRQIPQGLGLGKSTNFNDLIGSFSITNGRVNLGSFKLQSGDLFMDAAGLIDIGDQRLDFGLRPKLAAGSGIAKFGIPLKFSGKFGEAKAGIDTDVLAEIAAAKARASAGGLIKDTVGGTFGDILGGVIGGDQGAETDVETEPEGSTEIETSEPEGQAETPLTPPKVTDIVKLPAILGGGGAGDPDLGPTEAEPAAPEIDKPNATPPEAEPAAEPAPKAEEQIENALKDLFGRKKKTDTSE